MLHLCRGRPSVATGFGVIWGGYYVTNALLLYSQPRLPRKHHTLSAHGRLRRARTDNVPMPNGIQNGALDAPIRKVFGERGAEKRIVNCRKAMMPEFTKASLQDLLHETLDDLDWCRDMRNQYAHCTWYWDQVNKKLCFVNLEELAKQPTPIYDLMVNRRQLSKRLSRGIGENCCGCLWRRHPRCSSSVRPSA